MAESVRPRFFRHNDADDLERKLRNSKGRKLVVAEGVYSMEGDIGALDDIVHACRRHGARLLVDEAHSVFVYGPHGRGVAEHLGVYEDVDIVVGTMSKTLGGIGGFIAGSRDLVNYLRFYARTHMFSGGLPPAVVAGLIEALAIVRNEPQIRRRLWNNVALMREGLQVGRCGHGSICLTGDLHHDSGRRRCLGDCRRVVRSGCVHPPHLLPGGGEEPVAAEDVDHGWS